MFKKAGQKFCLFLLQKQTNMGKAKKTNLSELREVKLKELDNIKIGIVTAKWNEKITSALTKDCKQTLLEYGITVENIIKITVPGSFELPMGAKLLLSREKLDAVICLGCVIQGETPHNEYINQSVAHGLMNLSLASGKPCIFGVLTPRNMEQAQERAGGKHGNKGVEAALTALEMIELEQRLDKKDRSIGFLKK